MMQNAVSWKGGWGIRQAVMSLVLLTLAMGLSTVPVAYAAFPGSNGEVYYGTSAGLTAVTPGGGTRVIVEGLAGVDVSPDGSLILSGDRNADPRRLDPSAPRS